MSGLEVIGSIASVAQLAGAVYSISKTLYEVGDAISNAPSDIKDLARDLETFSEELYLLSSLLDGRTHHYSEQVYKLTAKIIGDCASICEKINRILKKLRSGSFLARVKWVFKEKEILKLLARLRDLKLSLMSTLNFLGALKADHMMDAMGVHNTSLLEGPKNEGISKQTAEEVKETKRKLAGILQNPDPFLLEATLTSQNSMETCEFEKGGDIRHVTDMTQSVVASTALLRSAPKPVARVLTRDALQAHENFFISTFTLPKDIPLAQSSLAMQSVESFHSALSTQKYDGPEAQDTPLRVLKSSGDSRFIEGKSLEQDTAASHRESQPQLLIKEWRSDMVDSAMKRFQMNRADAEAWASTLRLPDFPSKATHDILDSPPRSLVNTADSPVSAPTSTELLIPGNLHYSIPYYESEGARTHDVRDEADDPIKCREERSERFDKENYYHERRNQERMRRGKRDNSTDGESDNSIIYDNRPAPPLCIPSRSPRHKKRLVQGGLAGAGAAALLSTWREALKNDEELRGRQLHGAALAGPIDPHSAIRERSRYSNERERRSHSSSRSGGEDRSMGVDTALRVAAAAQSTQSPTEPTKEHRRPHRRSQSVPDLNTLAPSPLSIIQNRALRQISHVASTIAYDKEPKRTLVKGVLRQPRKRFPIGTSSIREGVAPLKDTNTHGVTVRPDGPVGADHPQPQQVDTTQEQSISSSSSSLEISAHITPLALPPSTDAKPTSLENRSRIVRKRNRVSLSCQQCRRRKLKCDRLQPCHQCVKNDIASSCFTEITDINLLQHRRRQRRLEEDPKWKPTIIPSADILQRTYDSYQPDLKLQSFEWDEIEKNPEIGNMTTAGGAALGEGRERVIRWMSDLAERDMILPSQNRLNDLWWLAFFELERDDVNYSTNLAKACADTVRHSDLDPELFETQIARAAADQLVPILKAAQDILGVSSDDICRSTESSIDRLQEILKVMQDTLEFKTGAFVWCCICTTAQNAVANKSVEDILRQSEIIEQLAEIATLVARYNVLESMYQQWPGMSLEKNYEESLISLCVHVLRFLNTALAAIEASDDTRTVLKDEISGLMEKIMDADATCRGFTVTIVSNEELGGEKRAVEDVDEDEDSDSTETGDQDRDNTTEMIRSTIPDKF